MRAFFGAPKAEGLIQADGPIEKWGRAEKKAPGALLRSVRFDLLKQRFAYTVPAGAGKNSHTTNVEVGTFADGGGSTQDSAVEQSHPDRPLIDAAPNLFSTERSRGKPPICIERPVLLKGFVEHLHDRRDIVAPG